MRKVNKEGGVWGTLHDQRKVRGPLGTLVITVGPGACIEVCVTAAKSFQELLAQSAPFHRPLQTQPWLHGSIPRPSSPGSWSLAETQNCRNSNHLLWKVNYYTLYFIWTSSGLSTLLSLLLYPPSLLGSRSIKSENHRKHHLGRQERLRQVWPHDKGLGLDLHRSG